MEQQTSTVFNPLEMIEDHAAKCNMTTWKLLITAGMDPSSMSRWRRGAMPHIRTLNKILSVEPAGTSED
jgi:hypothetical protein